MVTDALFCLFFYNWLLLKELSVKRNSEILPINVLINSESNREFKVEVNDGRPWPSKKHLSKSKTHLKNGRTYRRTLLLEISISRKTQQKMIG